MRRTTTRSLASISLMATTGLVIACLFLPPTAGAGTDAIYRCSGTYSDQPCPGAQLLTGLDDPRSESQRADAIAVARREAALAARMVRDREGSSASAHSVSSKSTKRRGNSNGAATAADPKPSSDNRTPGSRKRPAVDPDEFIAYVPKPPKQAVVSKAR